jgi:agmatine deiminase
MKTKPMARTAACMSLIFVAVAAAGHFVPEWIIRWQVERQAIEYFVRNDVSMPFQTFTTSTYGNLIGNAVPWARRYLDEGVVARLEKAVREAYAYRYEASTKGLVSGEDIAEYLRTTGLLGGMGLSREEVLERLSALDPSATALAPMRPFTTAYMDRPPGTPVRLPAEFEPIESVLVSFPILYPSQWKTHAALIAAIAAEATAVVLVPDESWHKAVLLYLLRDGLDLGNVRFAYVKTDDVWIRDYGPTNVMAGGGRAFIWNNYYERYTSYAKLSADAASELGRYYDVPVHRVPLVVEGGNIITDGKGTVVMFDSVLANNPDYDVERLRKVMEKYYGSDRLILLPSLEGELTGHVDMVVKFVDEDTLMVAESEESFRWHRDFEAIAGMLSGTKSSSGRNYEVIRVKVASGGKDPARFWSYINSVTVNGSVIVPVFGTKEDALALDLYGKAMPGYKVVGIDMSDYPVGSVHCQTKEIYR